MPRVLQQQKSKRRVKKKQKRKVIVPSASQVLGETASSRAWNSHLHFQSPTERYPTHLSSTKMDQHRQCLCCQNCWILSKYLTSPHTLFFQFLILVPESSGAPNEPAQFCLWTGSVLRLLWVTEKENDLPQPAHDVCLLGDLGRAAWEFCSNLGAGGR